MPRIRVIVGMKATYARLFFSMGRRDCEAMRSCPDAQPFRPFPLDIPACRDIVSHDKYVRREGYDLVSRLACIRRDHACNAESGTGPLMQHVDFAPVRLRATQQRVAIEVRKIMQFRLDDPKAASHPR